jgi:hypothetical protein
MNTLLRLTCCLAFLGISACDPQYNLVKSKEISSCKIFCLKQQESCQQRCVDNCPKCYHAATDSAANGFFKYTNVKQVEGGYINRRLISYRDPLQCRKVSCNCTADFLTCNQGCTGIIEKRLQSLPYCP